MNEHGLNALVCSIVNRVADYRETGIPRIDQAHVLRWLRQFDEPDQAVILREVNHLLARTYIPKEAAKRFVLGLVENPKLVGHNPQVFWHEVGFLNLQTQSQSQRDLLALLDEVLHEKFGLRTDRQESANRTYIYLDDAIFSGNQVRVDLLNWCRQRDVRNAHVHVIIMGLHRQGSHYARGQLGSEIRERGIRLLWWRCIEIEDRRAYIADSQVLRPTHLPDDPYVRTWEANFAEGADYFRPRRPGGFGSTGFFSSEAAREIVEQAFLKKGAYIYSLPQNPNRHMRPLGYSRLDSPGFGTMFITYRNCPNNAPLVLWWGDPNGPAPINRWTPLFPRRSRAPNFGAFFDVDF